VSKSFTGAFKPADHMRFSKSKQIHHTRRQACKLS